MRLRPINMIGFITGWATIKLIEFIWTQPTTIDDNPLFKGAILMFCSLFLISMWVAFHIDEDDDKDKKVRE